MPTSKKKSGKSSGVTSVDLTTAPYVLQYWDDEDQEWKPARYQTGAHVPSIAGKDAAYEMLNMWQREYPHWRWRVLPKSLADAYRAGLKHGKGIVDP
jgi:hypothetical protein